jgi:putative membrane protein
MAAPPRRELVVWIVVALLVLAVLPLLWGTAMMPMMGPWMTGGWATGASPWWVLRGPFFGLLMVGGVALLLVWALPRTDGSGDARGDERALAILKERYARGELSHEEYQRMRRVLADQE